MATFKDFRQVLDYARKDKTSGKRMRHMLNMFGRSGLLTHPTPEKAVALLEELGPTYIKIGQIASNRGDLLPLEYTQALKKLRSNAPTLSFETVTGVIEESYGHAWQETFESIDPTPLGSASIAQEHKATLRDGTLVAVKVRRPGIEKEMADDIMLMRHVMALLLFHTHAGTDTDLMLQSLDGFINELDRTTRDELDFSVEMNNLAKFYNLTKDQEGITSPKVFPAFSNKRVLVMEFIQGASLEEVENVAVCARQSAELEALSAGTSAPQSEDAVQRQYGISADELGNRIAQSYVTQIIDNGFFHADPHPGNMVLRDGQVVWIDLGMVGSMSMAERGVLAQVFKAIATHDAFACKEALLGLTTATKAVDQGALLTQLDALLRQYAHADMGSLDVGSAFSQMMEMMQSNGLRINPSVTMLGRGLLTLEGVIAALSPSVNIMSIVTTHVEEQMVSLNTAAEKAKELAMNAALAAEASTRIPLQATHVLGMAERNQLRFGMDVTFNNEFRGLVYSTVGLICLTLLAAFLFLGSCFLCTTEMDPQVLNVPFLGFLGYLGSAILSFYVIIRIVRLRHQQVNRQNFK
ncbi:MAG: AarF/UbiB family protein [Coriobacteriia bacterium]|nr:AarF/UbiB family protein [Coriobacteriia bacterium]